MSEYVYWADSDGLYKREEIVRCRDCRYYEEYVGSCTRRYHHFTVKPDGFCAWAERR